jgi:hypothetical protein
MPSWCRQVNWGNCGIVWLNCTVLCVKDDWKGQFWGQRYCLSKLRSLLSFSCAIPCQNCAVYSVFPSGMTSHSKIAQFNWECIGRFTICNTYCFATAIMVTRTLHNVTFMVPVVLLMRISFYVSIFYAHCFMKELERRTRIWCTPFRHCNHCYIAVERRSL